MEDEYVGVKLKGYRKNVVYFDYKKIWLKNKSKLI